MGRVKANKPRRARPPRFANQVVIPDFAIYSWVSQAMQYPQHGEPGITHTVEYCTGDDRPIDCLTYYSDGGQLIGILNHYRCDMDGMEKAGNINIWVHPEAQRSGVGLALVTRADELFGINWDQQRFTSGGAALAERYLELRGRRDA